MIMKQRADRGSGDKRGPGPVQIAGHYLCLCGKAMLCVLGCQTWYDEREMKIKNVQNYGRADF